MDSNLITFLAVAVAVVLIVVLYRAYASRRSSQQDPYMDVVNDTNYNIAAGDSEVEAIKNSDENQVRNIVETQKQAGPSPVSDETFIESEKKLDTGAHDTESVREQLRHPER